MKIYAKKKHHFNGSDEYYNRLPMPSQVIILGDYLKKAKDKNTGVSKFMVYKTERSSASQGYDLYITIMYQIPSDFRQQMKDIEKRLKEHKDELMRYGGDLRDVNEKLNRIQEELKNIEEDVYEANVLLSIAAYNNQFIRLNVILLNEGEETLGFLRLDKTDLMSLSGCKQKLVDFIYKKILKKFKKYDVMI